METAVESDMFRRTYAEVFTGDDRWQRLPVPGGDRYEWDDASTYVHKPPFFDDLTADPAPVRDIEGARCSPSSATA